jgi:hypothetical protein
MLCNLIAVRTRKYLIEISHLDLAGVAVRPRHHVSSSSFVGGLHFLTYQPQSHNDKAIAVLSEKMGGRILNPETEMCKRSIHRSSLNATKNDLAHSEGPEPLIRSPARGRTR